MDAASIWKRLKMTWILAMIVIQFVDLSVNRKYQFPSFIFSKINGYFDGYIAKSCSLDKMMLTTLLV